MTHGVRFWDVRRKPHIVSRCVQGWRGLIGSLMFIGHFLRKWPIFSGSFVEIDLQLRGSYGSSPPCTYHCKAQSVQVRHVTFKECYVAYLYNAQCVRMKSGNLFSRCVRDCCLPHIFTYSSVIFVALCLSLCDMGGLQLDGVANIVSFIGLFCKRELYF